jgi:hypothetical protein
MSFRKNLLHPLWVFVLVLPTVWIAKHVHAADNFSTSTEEFSTASSSGSLPRALSMDTRKNHFRMQVQRGLVRNYFHIFAIDPERPGQMGLYYATVIGYHSDIRFPYSFWAREYELYDAHQHLVAASRGSWWRPHSFSFHDPRGGLIGRNNYNLVNFFVNQSSFQDVTGERVAFSQILFGGTYAEIMRSGVLKANDIIAQFWREEMHPDSPISVEHEYASLVPWTYYIANSEWMDVAIVHLYAAALVDIQKKYLESDKF